jgi:hypothetical protein
MPFYAVLWSENSEANLFSGSSCTTCYRENLKTTLSVSYGNLRVAQIIIIVGTFSFLDTLLFYILNTLNICCIV